MKSFTAFFSVIALGLIAGAVFITSLTTNVSPLLGNVSAGSNTGIDHLSLFIGIVIGALTANLARMEWASMPRRVAQWAVANGPTFGYIVTAIALGFVVIFY